MLRHYCEHGLADSTRRTYRSGINCCLSFCFAYRVQPPFSTTETLLCYFVTSLAEGGCAPATIKTYLAAVRHAQIMRGHPEPRESSSLPRLCLVQNGVRRKRAEAGHLPDCHLPITPSILRLLRPSPASDRAIMNAFGGRLPHCVSSVFPGGRDYSVCAFDPRMHLAWGDVSISDNGRALRVLLKRSKTDQFMRGVEVFVGTTGNDICPIDDMREFVSRRGTATGVPGWDTPHEIPLCGASPRGANASRSAR